MATGHRVNHQRYSRGLKGRGLERKWAGGSAGRGRGREGERGGGNEAD